MTRSREDDAEMAAYARQMKKEQEIADIEAFLAAYSRATDEELEASDFGESPDAVCLRPDGTEVGLEFTTVRRSPDKAFWDSVFRHDGEMDPDTTNDEITRLIRQKARLLPQFRTIRTILVLGICESDFGGAISRASHIPLDDLRETRFEEIWLADYKGIRDGAHREVQLFGLYPEENRVITGRSWYDQKPYG
jgi:hypothetical protein